MNGLNEQKGLFYYFAITYAVSWFLWLLGVLESQNLIFCQYSDFIVKLGGFVPSIVGLLITSLHYKKMGIKSLFRKALKLKFHVLWYVYIFLLMPSITFFSYLITSWTKGVSFESILLPFLRQNYLAIIPMLLYFIIFQGPLGEEFGWRGYALESLMLRWNPLMSSIVLGFFWSIWHLPLFFISGTIQNILAEQGIAITFAGYIFYTIMLTIQITVIYIKTGKSLFSVILFHAVANFSHGLFTVILTPVGGLSVLILMFILTTVTIFINRELFLFSNMKTENLR